MPRQPRLILSDVAVHVIQRGNNRAACFREEGDYLLYLAYLRELATRHGCLIHAYCLMTNHVHLLLTPEHPAACASLMRDLGQRYVQSFNRRHERTGTLWEGRFRSCVTESSRYVLACYRYIEMNPVRAGMASHASLFPWSSHLTNIGQRADALVSPHIEYLALGTDPDTRGAAYRLMLEDPADSTMIDAIREATNSGYPLGSRDFKAAILAATGRRIAPGQPGRPPLQPGDRRR